MKGIASRNSLKALAHPVQQFVAGWGAGERAARVEGAGGELPAPYELAALRGEAVLRDRFFGALMERMPVKLDATQQVAMWHEMVERGGLVTAWVQRLGIAKALRREAVLPADAANESRKLYTLLLDALRQQAPELLPWAVEGYWWHCWKAQFPQSSTRPEAPPHGTTTQAEVLRERLVRALRRRHAQAVEVKESFQQEPKIVRFSLLFKQANEGRWEPLVTVERPRLKTARLAGYEAALKLAAGDSARDALRAREG